MGAEDEDMNIRSGSLRRLGSDMHQASVDLYQAWKDFQPDAKNLKHGSTDLVGSLIGASYDAVLSWAHTSYDSAAEAFTTFGKAIHTMADRYDTTDQAGKHEAEQAGKSV